MKINSQTKISSLIKHNEKSIEAIASINSHFNKLRNPILRKLLASRVTISDAAKIGNCDIQLLYDKLQGIGFDIETVVLQKDKNTNTMMPASISEAFQKGQTIELDVRPLLENGVDPFAKIMAEIKRLPLNSALKLVNTFEPIPLIKILNEKGYSSYVEKEGATVITWFIKGIDPGKTVSKNNSTSECVECSNDEFEAKVLVAGQFLISIDVRALEMPGPMVKTLEALEAVKQDYQLLVIHRKVPKYLFLELQNLQYGISYTVVDENLVKILINKWNR